MKSTSHFQYKITNCPIFVILHCFCFIIDKLWISLPDTMYINLLNQCGIIVTLYLNCHIYIGPCTNSITSHYTIYTTFPLSWGTNGPLRHTLSVYFPVDTAISCLLYPRLVTGSAPHHSEWGLYLQRRKWDPIYNLSQMYRAPHQGHFTLFHPYTTTLHVLTNNLPLTVHVSCTSLYVSPI